VGRLPRFLGPIALTRDQPFDVLDAESMPSVIADPNDSSFPSRTSPRTRGQSDAEHQRDFAPAQQPPLYLD